MVAPPGMRPAERWFTCTDEPPCDAPAPLTTRLPCDIAYTRPSAPLSGVSRRVPPRRDFALPMDDTVTSSDCPGWAKGGSIAVTITAATFFNCRLVPGGRLTPNCCSMDVMLCTVNGVWVVWSPLPSSPTTSP